MINEHQTEQADLMTTKTWNPLILCDDKYSLINVLAAISFPALDHTLTATVLPRVEVPIHEIK